MDALNIQRLPNEVLLHVFSYFQADELCYIICNVCERWRYLARDKILWSTLSYACDSETDPSCIRKVLNFSPGLKVFSLYSRADASKLLQELCDNCESLQRLELRFCSLGSENLTCMKQIVNRYPKLCGLLLQGCQPLDTEALLHISSLTCLKTLNLSNLKRLTGGVLWYIVRHCHQLTELNIDQVNKVYDNNLKKILRRLSSQLVILTLDGESLTDESYKELQHCRRLIQLEISFCDQMTDEGLLKGIAPLVNITYLRLNQGRQLSAEALFTFLNRTDMSSLLHLNLSGCSSLDDWGLQGIAKNCNKLKYLVLQRCWKVTDVGVTSIITHCSQLHTLDLLGAVQVTGIDGFKTIPSCVPYLKFMNLCECESVCDEEVIWLAKKMPKLVIIDYHGYDFSVTEYIENEENEKLYKTLLVL